MLVPYTLAPSPLHPRHKHLPSGSIPPLLALSPRPRVGTLSTLAPPTYPPLPHTIATFPPAILSRLVPKAARGHVEHALKRQLVQRVCQQPQVAQQILWGGWSWLRLGLANSRR